LVLGCVFSKSNSDSSSNDEGLELVAVLNPYAYTVIHGIMMSKVGLYIEVKNFYKPPTVPDFYLQKLSPSFFNILNNYYVDIRI